MVRALVAACGLFSVAALAQTAAADGGVAPSTLTGTGVPGASADAEAIRREVDQKVEAAKKEIREEVRAELANQAASQNWQEDSPLEDRRKLQLIVPNGYLRVRPDLFNKFDLGRGLDSMGYPLFPHSQNERTVAGVNMRFRFEPTLNVSEEVRIKTQIDALNNVLWGSTPDYASGYNDRYAGSLLSETISPPQAGVNSLQNSVLVRRVWGEVSTPVGVLRFGRMGNQWGLGMVHNDGNCLDCDYGETVDRAQFVFEPFHGYFIIPMIDFNAEGATSASNVVQTAQPWDLTNSDDSHSLVLALARKDTDAEAKAKLENGLSVFNYGVHFTYRVQKYMNVLSPASSAQPYDVTSPGNPTLARIRSNGTLYTPDLWVKFEKKRFRLELEVAGNFGNESLPAVTLDPASAPNTTTPLQNIYIVQFAAAGEAEVRLLDGALRINLNIGYASGDKSPGLGNKPSRYSLINGKGGQPVGTPAGSIDGAQYNCSSATVCSDNAIRNFRFAQDYRIDLILWREILGGITDALYARPSVTYNIVDGLSAYAAVIYSRTVFKESTPNGSDPNLGVEFNVGAKYETQDGFFAKLEWGLLIPLAGLKPDVTGSTVNLDVAQAVRANVGIHF